MRLHRSAPGIAAGVLALLLVSVVGAGFAFSRAARWDASTSLLVLPRANESIDAGTVAGFFDTLGGGEIVATYAEVLRNSTDGDDLTRIPGVSARDAAGTTLTVTAVPNTTVIRVTASADSADAARRVVAAVATRGAGQLSALSPPFVTRVVGDADPGTATRTGLSRSLVLMVVALLALVAAVSAQQAVWLVQRRRVRTGHAGAHSGSTSPADPSPSSPLPAPAIVDTALASASTETSGAHAAGGGRPTRRER